jgi:tRNA nucleotidyltransferase (CCA-adding enzyme)
VLRHVTDAFREDPVRILRVARFAARFTDFSVAPETMALMRDMVARRRGGRTWCRARVAGAGARADGATPSRMFEVLRECGALQGAAARGGPPVGRAPAPDYHPEVDTGVHLMMVLDMSARLNAPLPCALPA